MDQLQQMNMARDVDGGGGRKGRRGKGTEGMGMQLSRGLDRQRRVGEKFLVGSEYQLRVVLLTRSNNGISKPCVQMELFLV